MKPYLVNEIITEPTVTVGELRGGESSLLRAIVQAIGGEPHGGQSSGREEPESAHRRRIPMPGGRGPTEPDEPEEEHRPVILTPSEPNRRFIPF